MRELRSGLFPSLNQHAFLLTDHIEDVLFGGAAGGGKSEALAASALQYVDVPGYASLIFRATYQDLQKPDALVPRLREILAGTDAHWRGDKMEWTFPSGATLGFGYLDSEGDEENYQGAAAQHWAFDEAGQLRPRAMQYLKTRARRRAGVNIPIRFRYSANPGGQAHEFLVREFVMGAPANGKLFIPSRAVDNPGLDQEYRERLAAIDDPVLRAQMLEGDWAAMDRTGLVCPEWDAETERECTITNDWMEQYVTAYAAGDPGGHAKESARDLFAMLWGHLNFIGGKLVITDERAWRNPDTETVGTEAVLVEAERWGLEDPSTLSRVTRKETPAHVYEAMAERRKRVTSRRRVTDLDGRLVNDLKKEPYRLSFVHTQKTDAQVWERMVRTAIRQRRILVHARCARLLKTLKYARFTGTGDYERTEETGHADLWKALCYMYRVVQWDENPYPAPEKTREQAFREQGQQHVRGPASALQQRNLIRPLR